MSQIGAANPIGAAIQDSAPRDGFSALTSEDFIKIIFTELSNQDPFQPNDSGALLEQLNSIRSIESDLQLIERLDSLVFENQLSSSANLIGKTIRGLSTNNDPVEGRVRAVLREGDQVRLELESGERLSVDSVISILGE